ncbi:DNA topoisomerase VI subunit B [Nanoarchaeota archaeon]
MIYIQTKLSEKPKTQQTKAHELAKKQREISVAEFFEKNRHLLGFDNNKKALLTTVKEAVDNSLDACEEAQVLPELLIEIIDMQNNRFRVIVEDNGPGIVKAQIPKIFAKLLYGSKFHSMKQSRGQQGIGISAAALYGQLTTGRPIRITSKIHPTKPAEYAELEIDTKTNKPKILKSETKEWNKDHGIKIELDIEASYSGGKQSVDEFLKETAIANPHATIIYVNPKAEQIIFPRAVNELPKEPKEIKPHPYGVELGILIRMLKDSESRTLQSFFTNDFSRVGAGTAKQICEVAALPPNTKPKSISRQQSEKLIDAIKKTRIMNPPTDCISPIGDDQLEKGMKKEVQAEFFTTVTRPPNVYRGRPFVIEVGLAYGGELPKDKSIQILRYANRVPLLYQQGACAITDSIQKTSWRSYGLSQSQNSTPIGPVVVVVHMASVWVPFTSEAKEALAHYPEIIKEIKLALQECGRKLGSYVGKKRRIGDELKKRSYIEKYIPHVASALTELLKLSKTEEGRIEDKLKALLEQKRGKIEKIEADNTEYDEEFAKIGKDEVKKESEEGKEEGKKEKK